MMHGNEMISFQGSIVLKKYLFLTTIPVSTGSDMPPLANTRSATAARNVSDAFNLQTSVQK
jgi:hypothetical protein